MCVSGAQSIWQVCMCVCVSVSVSVSVGDTYALASLVVQAVKNLPAMQETQV